MAVAANADEILCSFLEVAFHHILFNRSIYPAAIFDRRRVFGIAVRTSRHPELSEYIANVVGGVRTWLREGTLQRVVLVILSPEVWSLCVSLVSCLEKLLLCI